MGMSRSRWRSISVHLALRAHSPAHHLIYHGATGHTWHHSDRRLFDMVKNGTAGMMPGYETDMPAYKDIFSDADIWAVLSYIESTWRADIRQRQQRMNRQAQ
jgi:hypothetical protein